ncbi:hypothetical protein EJ04DRAFT_580801 [Polyplosphaeria fusca]|uniref:Uncharacterized protein n=1 Tax=Polyplosphaeria fusca TaxID=682080 RepID=A0A9P4QP97_9PLEO|nr:hypothetical protein EJ04DRAFT_580801 [Polyplosphaeria fusca]
MMIPPSMSPLLSLPRELRDKIIQEALFILYPTPSHESAERRLCLSPQQHKQHANIFYATDRAAYRPNLSGLLFTNWQLRSETLQSMQKAKLKSICAVEMRVVKEIELWPTWQYICPKTSVIDVLLVTVLVDSAPTTDFSGLYKTHPTIFGAMTGFLRRFLSTGPVLPQRLGENAIPPCMRVKQVTFDFVHPPLRENVAIAPPGLPVEKRSEWKDWTPYEGERYWERYGNPDLHLDDEKEYVLHPFMVAQAIEESFRYFMTGSHSSNTWIYERVGEVAFTVNGNEWIPNFLTESIKSWADIAFLPIHRTTSGTSELDRILKVRNEFGLPVHAYGPINEAQERRGH